MLRICCFMLRPEAIRPEKSKDILDAGHDIFTPEVFTLEPGERKTVNTGLVIWYEWAIEPALSDHLSWYPRLAPKSGLAAKNGLTVLGGVVDRGYCGPEDEVKVVLLNTGDRELRFGTGAAICQIIPEVIWLVENMLADERPSAVKLSSRGGLGSGTTG